MTPEQDDLRKKKYFKYKGNQYCIIGFGVMKDRTTREWVAAVKYVEQNDPFAPECYREQQDFINKFSPYEVHHD